MNLRSARENHENGCQCKFAFCSLFFLVKGARDFMKAGESGYTESHLGDMGPAHFILDSGKE